MNELTSNIFSKYGLRGLFGMLLIVIIIWSAAHYMSASGKKVSVFWGLIEYTKPIESLSSREVTSSVPPLGTVSNEIEASSSKQLLEPLNIFFKTVQESEVKTEIEKLREVHSLRKLAPLESGKTISKTPKGTYFYTLDRWFNISNEIFDREMLRFEVHATSKKFELEIQHANTGEYYLVGFVSKTHAIDISQISGRNNHQITFSKLWRPDFPTLIRIPASRIIQSKYRDLDMPKEFLGVLDIELQ